MEDVWLHVYDLSQGLLEAATSTFLKNPLQGIWHSSLVLYGMEIEYGPKGITCSKSGQTFYTLVKKIYLGKTSEDRKILLDYLAYLNMTKFKGENYNLFHHNCHCFANYLANELVHKNIPDYLLNLPKDMALNIITNKFI